MGRCRLYMLTALFLCLGIGARADNVITISSTEGAPNEEVMVSLALQNSDALSSLQVSIPLDESLTLVENSAQVGSRCSGHSLTVGVKEGVLNILLYSTSMAAITGKSGEVVSFKLKLGSQPETINLTPSKLVLTSTSGAAVEGSSQAGSVTTRCAKAQYSTMEVNFGAVPIRSSYVRTVTVTNVGNADLTITALTFSDASVFSSTTSANLPMTITAGNSAQLNITYAPTERGSISKTLRVECNSSSKLNTITLVAQPFAVNELHIQPATGNSDEEVTVRMTMNNMDDISGYQVEFNLPSQFEYVDNSFEQSSRKQNQASVVSYNNKVLRIMVYSSSDTPLAGNDGEIGSFRMRLVGRNGTTLTPSKTILSSTINNQVENVMSKVYGGYITVRSPQINANSSLNMGAVSVTASCEKTFTISNYGSAPLTISRVVFNNEGMSIKESLPIEIPANHSSRTITVVYDDTEQSAFSGTMQIYTNDPEQRLTSVAVTGSRFAPNYMSMSSQTVFAEENLVVKVATNNYDALTGLQFDVEYPGQYFENYDGNVALTNRATGMSVTSRQIDDNTLRFFCYFLGGGSIAAGSGDVMSIQLQRKAEVPVSNYQVRIRNIKQGTSDLDNKYAGGTTLNTNFAVNANLLGDPNSDGNVDTQDAILTIRKYLGYNPGGFQTAPADYNRDGQIDTQDAILIIQKYLNQ